MGYPLSPFMDSVSGSTPLEQTDYIVCYTREQYENWVLQFRGKRPKKIIPDLRLSIGLAAECERLARACADTHTCICECSLTLPCCGHKSMPIDSANRMVGKGIGAVSIAAGLRKKRASRSEGFGKVATHHYS